MDVGDRRPQSLVGGVTSDLEEVLDDVFDGGIPETVDEAALQRMASRQLHEEPAVRLQADFDQGRDDLLAAVDAVENRLNARIAALEKRLDKLE